ncbi:restriction endonuclease subunit S [Aquimarina aggregata]|nr:restriction endonuclease subunit S [Aquimarina aggregata]
MQIKNFTTLIKRGITPKYTEENGTLVINQRCIRHSKIDLSLARKHNTSLRAISSDKLLQKYDVLVNSTGVGTLGRVSQYLDNDSITVDSHVTIIRPDLTKVDPLYFGFLIRNCQDRIESLAEGSTGQTELSRISLGDLDLNFIDDKIVQQKIGRFLYNLDRKVWLNEEINSTLKSISQTIFNSWFINFDVVRAKAAALENDLDPLFAGMQEISGKTKEELQLISDENYQSLTATTNLFPDEFEETKYGQIPKGWKWMPLYSTAEYVNGCSFKSKDFSTDKSGLPIIKIAELKAGIAHQTKFTNAEVKAKYAIDNGSLLYSWSGSPETSLEVFKWFGGKGWLNQHIFLINTSSLSQKAYVFNLLTHMKPVLIDVAKNKQTTGLGHVTVADMKRIHVAVPDENGLKAITEYLVPLYQMDSNNTLQNENLKQQRDTLIPKLLSGELEIN